MSDLKIKKNKEKILKLLNENIDLEHKKLIKSFKNTYEKEINVGTKRNPKMVIAKYGIWYEYFEDEDEDFPNKRIRIERNVIYEIDGKIHGRRYYTIDDI
jgi:hypothetical protein